MTTPDHLHAAPTPTELAAWLRLALTPGVGNAAARRLLSSFGLPENIFSAPPAALRGCVSAAQAQALGRPPEGFDAQLELTLRWLDDHASAQAGLARAVITLADARYPAALLQTEDPPLLLYVAGAVHHLRHQPFPTACLAMVGSRNPTAQGAENARQFAQHLQRAGWTIVSGLALGVDAAAHEGALTDRPASGVANESAALPPATIAVVGTGLDRVYPRQNLELAHRIARHGLLVSEYPLGTPPIAANFPKRNRIIAGLSQGTLVVEAALASGSLITARLASEQGREVFAVPGSIHAPQSRGCHALIRQGAKLVESAQDILEELPVQDAAAAANTHGVAGPAAKPATAARSPTGPATSLPEARPAAEASEAPHALLQALGFDPMGLDALVARTGMPAPLLQVQLLELELSGQVARLPGGLFQRLVQA